MFQILIYVTRFNQDKEALDNLKLSLKSVKEHFFFPNEISVIIPKELQNVQLVAGKKRGRPSTKEVIEEREPECVNELHSNMEFIALVKEMLCSFVGGYVLKTEVIDADNIPSGLNTVLKCSSDATYALIMNAGLIVLKGCDAQIFRIVSDKLSCGGSCKIVDRNMNIIHAGIDSVKPPFTRHHWRQDVPSRAPYIEKVTYLPPEFIVLRKDLLVKTGVYFNTEYDTYMWSMEWSSNVTKCIPTAFHYFPYRLVQNYYDTSNIPETGTKEMKEQFEIDIKLWESYCAGV